MSLAAIAIMVFSILVGAAVVYRRDAPSHKRLMLLATLVILDAATRGCWLDRRETGAYRSHPA